MTQKSFVMTEKSFDTTEESFITTFDKMFVTTAKSFVKSENNFVMDENNFVMNKSNFVMAGVGHRRKAISFSESRDKQTVRTTSFPGSLFFPPPLLGAGRRETLGTRLQFGSVNSFLTKFFLGFA